MQLVEPNYPVYGTCLCLGFVVVFIEREKEEERGGRGTGGGKEGGAEGRKHQKF